MQKRDLGGSPFDEIQYRDRDIPRQVLLDVVELAIEIAREGREGRKIGTLFIIGDHESVLRRSRSLILDPLVGHPKQARMMHDPNLRETIKELAQLDGGFIVTNEGEVLSAARFFVSDLPRDGLSLGLGTRHLAAASITTATDALGVVVSESSVVRLFADGALVAEIVPELWLLHRHSSHIAHSVRTEHPVENLAVMSPTDCA